MISPSHPFHLSTLLPQTTQRAAWTWIGWADVQLYALYKYVTMGPKPPISRPSIWDGTDRAKWDAWSSVEGKHGFTAPEQAEARYLELCKELGWVPDATPPVPVAQTKKEEEEEIDWDAPDDLTPRPIAAGGMANAVSVIQQEEEEPLDLNTLHGVVLAGDLERLRAMGQGEIDLNFLDEYVSTFGMTKDVVLDTNNVFIGVYTAAPRGGPGPRRACSGAPVHGRRSGHPGTWLVR